MNSSAVLKALALKMDQVDEDSQIADKGTRILIAASLQLVGNLALELKLPVFDLNDQVEKAFLIRAVGQVCPEELDDEDILAVKMLNEAENSRRN
jgi:hypothetical protein